MKETSYLSVRMDRAAHDKIRYVAAYEGRSMSAQIVGLIQKCILEFEKEHGSISEEELKSVHF